MAELPGKQASEGCRNMRTLETSEIIRNIKEMCIEANHFLTPDMEEALRKAQDSPSLYEPVSNSSSQFLPSS